MFYNNIYGFWALNFGFLIGNVNAKNVMLTF